MKHKNDLSFNAKFNGKQKFGFRNVMKNNRISDLFRGPDGIPSKNKNPERAKKIAKALKVNKSTITRKFKKYILEKK